MRAHTRPALLFLTYILGRRLVNTTIVYGGGGGNTIRVINFRFERDNDGFE